MSPRARSGRSDGRDQHADLGRVRDRLLRCARRSIRTAAHRRHEMTREPEPYLRISETMAATILILAGLTVTVAVVILMRMLL